MRLRKDKIIMKEKKVSSSEIDDFGSSIHPKNNDLDLTFRETTIIIRHRHFSIQRGHPSMMSPTRGEGGSAKRWRYFISLFIKITRGDRGVKNLKKWMTSFMDGPWPRIKNTIYGSTFKLLYQCFKFPPGNFPLRHMLREKLC